MTQHFQTPAARMARSGERILLTLWVGGMWAVGYIVAPTLFSLLERSVAGTVAGRIFEIMSYIGLVCGGLLLLGALIHCAGKRLREPRVWILIGMLAVIVAGQFVLAPAIAALRDAGFEPGTAEAARFGRLHGAASILFLINSLLGLALVVFGLPARAGESDQPGAQSGS